MTSDEAVKLLETLKAEREITRVLQSYCRGSDRKDFELMRSAYHDDAYDDHGPFKGKVDDFIAWGKVHHEKFHQMMHLTNVPAIDVCGSVAFVETYCLLFQHKKVEQSDEKAEFIWMAFRYMDRFEKRAEQWKIAHRVLVFDWIRASHESSSEFAPFPIRHYLVGKRSIKDVTYNLLAGTFPE